MPLFLITSLYDESLSPNDFRGVEAESKRAIAQHLLEHPDQWDDFLNRSFHEERLEPALTTEQLLEHIEQARVDGDSGGAQVPLPLESLLSSLVPVIRGNRRNGASSRNTHFTGTEYFQYSVPAGSIGQISTIHTFF